MSAADQTQATRERLEQLAAIGRQRTEAAAQQARMRAQQPGADVTVQADGEPSCLACGGDLAFDDRATGWTCARCDALWRLVAEWWELLDGAGRVHCTTWRRLR